MSRTQRYIYAALGAACATLGAIGIFVPGLPTTVFLIAASWLFSKSCPVLDRWLRESRWLGEPLRRFEESRAMTARAKVLAIASMWAGIAVGAVATGGMTPLLPAGMITLGIVGSGVILFHVRTEPAVLAASQGAARGR